MIMIPIYEFLPVILASISLVYSSVKKNLATVALILGAITATVFFAFSSGMKDMEKEALRVIVYIAASCLVVCSLTPLAYRIGRFIPGLTGVQGGVSGEKRDPATGLRRFDLRWLLSKTTIYSALLLLAAGGLILIYAFMIGNDAAADKLTSTLLLLCAAASVVLYAHFGKAKPLVKFLIYWAAMSLVIYSFFGERMPWLSLHIVLPAIILGGAFIGYITKGLNREKMKKWIPTRDSKGVHWVYSTGLIIAVATLLFLTGYTAFVACRESYQVADEPPQMLLYAGVSADVPRIADRIKELANDTGEGYGLSVTVDSDIFYSGWSWYLRDYTSIDTPGLASMSSVPQGTVLILRADHDPSDRQYMEKYGEGERIRLLIWFPEDYKGNFKVGWWWDYFWGRNAGASYLKTEAIVYFPKDYE